MKETQTLTSLKLTIASYLLSMGDMFLVLDATQEGVIVPEDKRVTGLILHWRYNTPNPIRNMLVDEQGISGALSFGGRAHGVYVPWEAVFSMSDTASVNPDTKFHSYLGGNQPIVKVEPKKAPAKSGEHKIVRTFGVIKGGKV